MASDEQGVQQCRRFLKRLLYTLLFVVIQLPALAQNNQKSSAANAQGNQHILIIYSDSSNLQSEISRNLSKTLSASYPDSRINTITPDSLDTAEKNNADLIVAIGVSNIEKASTVFADRNKLFIVSDPATFTPVSRATDTNINTATLYMAQPYCRQLHFISLLDNNWTSVSYLSSEQKPLDNLRIQQCASKYELTSYHITITKDDIFTHKLKHALDHSDLLLALPDKHIYNSHTVKNILLTSYRYRKPVIAFSKNFVSAGALASIHSNVRQISHKAISVISEYIDNNRHFKKAEYFPDDFYISINKQVFRALDIDLPDLQKIKESIKRIENTEAGSRQ